jgi:hypothetical protein
MKKTWIILAVLAVLALVNTVSAFGPITYSYNGDVSVTYISKSAAYNNEFGIALPNYQSLGFINGNTPETPGTVYPNVERCAPDVPIVLYISTPDQQTYYSDQAGSDGLDHASVAGPVNGIYEVGFEDIYGVKNIPGKPGDADYNDVVLSVTCTRDVIPTPEFPTMALPVGLIVGILGVVLFIQKSKEN